MGDHCWIVAGMPAKQKQLIRASQIAAHKNAFCSGVAIIALLRHKPREKRGVGLRMRTKPEHMLFRPMWETYFCVHFDSRNGRLKPLQSFWYTLYKTFLKNVAIYYNNNVSYNHSVFRKIMALYLCVCHTSLYIRILVNVLQL